MAGKSLFSLERIVALELENRKLSVQLEKVTAERDELQEKCLAISSEYDVMNEFIHRMSKKLRKFTATKPLTSTPTSALPVLTTSKNEFEPTDDEPETTGVNLEASKPDAVNNGNVEETSLEATNVCLEEPMPEAINANEPEPEAINGNVEEPEPEAAIPEEFEEEPIVEIEANNGAVPVYQEENACGNSDPYSSVLDSVSQFYLAMESFRMKDKALLDIRADFPGLRMIIFCNGVKKVKYLRQYFQNRKMPVLAVHETMHLWIRENLLQEFCSGSGRFLTLLTTEMPKNLFAKNLKLQDVSVMVNYELPHTPESYQTRISLCGDHLEKTGIVINLIVDGCGNHQKLLQEYETYFKTDIVEWT